MHHPTLGKRDGNHWYASFGILMLDGGLVLGPVTGTYYSLLKKEISNIPTFTRSLLIKLVELLDTMFRKVTKYKSVMKNGHDWSPASIDFGKT